MSGAPKPEPGNETRPPSAAEADGSWANDVRGLWEGADYPAVAEFLWAAGREVGIAAGRGAGRHGLDLATGTGSVALALAEAGWRVTAIDLAPRLMAVGDSHAIARGLAVEWKQASMTEIPAADASVDLVTSGFGLIFAPNPQEALTEVSRVLRPGGLLILSAWTPTGTMGQMTSRIGEFLNRQEVFMAPFRWGDPAVSDTWLQPQFTQVQHRTHVLHWPCETPDEATQWFFDCSPGHRSALLTAAEQGPALRESVSTWMTEVAGGNHAFDLSPTYLVTTARRA